MKLIHSEKYKDYLIEVTAKYIKDHYDWDEGYTNAVELDYEVFTPLGKSLYIERFQFEIIAEKKPKRFLFWSFQPKTTFEEDVRNELKELIEYIKEKIDKEIFENKMTEGLLDSLRK